MKKIILPYPSPVSEEYFSALMPGCKFLYLIEHEDKIYKKNITFNYEELREGEIVCVGAEVLKHLFRASGVTKFHGTVQTFFSKELGEDISVGVSIDPAICEIYPAKETEVLKGIRALVSPTETVTNPKVHRIVETVMEAIEVLEYAVRAPWVVIDLETSALYPHKGSILGFIFSTKPHEGYYIPTNLMPANSRQYFLQFKRVIGHNFKFDYKWLHYNNYLFSEDCVFEDTMIMAYCIDENAPKGLKDLAVKLTDLGAYDSELDTQKKLYCKKYKVKVADFSYAFLPPEVLGVYGCKDGDATAQLFVHYEPKITTPIYRVMVDASIELALLELWGAYIDKSQLVGEVERYQEMVNNLYLELTEIVADFTDDLSIINFNANSVKQVAYILYDLMGYEVLLVTDTGAPSTSREALDLLQEKYETSPFITKLLEYRKAMKFKSTYLDSILENLDTDSRIRTNFNVTGTTSGRLSSSGTINLQNIPSKDKTIKKLFKPSQPGWKYYQQDLGTAEVWVAAYLSDDKFLQEAFVSGMDFHSFIAKRVFKLDCEVHEVKTKYPKERQAAKAITFGIMYQAGAAKIASELKCSKATAQGYIDLYFREAHQLKKWIDTQLSLISNNGKIDSILGRTRNLPEVYSTNSYISEHHKKSGLNFLIQSVASDINLIGYTKGMKRIRKENLRFIPNALVHDSITGEAHPDDAQRVYEIFCEEIRAVLKDAFHPIKIDLELGTSWGELG
jgi:DNA polymerase I-like protein with 3'-5' exonuclease and polymerase domains